MEPLEIQVPSANAASRRVFELHFGPFWNARRVFGVFLASLYVLGAFFIAPQTGNELMFPEYAIAYAVFLVVVLAATALWRAYRRRSGGLAPIRFDVDSVELPTRTYSRKVACIPYEKITAVSLTGWSFFRRLTVYTRERNFTFPHFIFSSLAMVEDVIAEMRDRVLALPSGAAQWAAMSRRADAAHDLKKIWPWVSIAAVGLVAIVYVAQVLTDHASPVYGFGETGGNSWLLLLEGQWFRLVTANFLHLNLEHFLSNALLGLILGWVVERKLGRSRFAILVMTSGIFSAAASALLMYLRGQGLYSFGFSGVVYALLGGIPSFGSHVRRSTCKWLPRAALDYLDLSHSEFCP